MKMCWMGHFVSFGVFLSQAKIKKLRMFRMNSFVYLITMDVLCKTTIYGSMEKQNTSLQIKIRLFKLNGLKVIHKIDIYELVYLLK